MPRANVKKADTTYNRVPSILPHLKVAPKKVVLTLPQPHPSQFDFINAFEIYNVRFIVGACGTKFGKCLDVDTPIATTGGWKTHGELKAGDFVFDENGSPVRVFWVSERKYNEDCYEVLFSDGSRIVTNGEHLWLTETHNTRRSRMRKDRPMRYTNNLPELVSTEDIRATLVDGGRYNHSVQNCQPVQYERKNLPFDPYLLGLWLGDGCHINNTYSSIDEELVQSFRDAGFDPQKRKGADWLIPGITNKLREVSVFGNKHIPVIYLTGSYQQRLAILQGLMDTDGTISTKGTCCFYNTNINLAEGVRELCSSFGIKASFGSKQPKINGSSRNKAGELYSTCYKVSFTTDLPVFRLKRKLERLRRIACKCTRRTIIAVNPIESRPVNCIAVDSDSHLYLAGKSYIATHNTFGCSIRIVREAWENKGSLNWWVAPTFVQSKMAYETVKSMLPVGTFLEYKADLKLVILEPDGAEHSQIVFKSGDNPDSLRGFGVDFFVLDEAARISYESFVSIMTTVTQTGGRGIIISTPKGRGWFFDVHSRGVKVDELGNHKFSNVNPDPFPEWKSIRLPTWENPHVPIESIEQARKNLPEDVFRQEYAAEFIDDSAGVFRGVSGCIKGTNFEPYNPNSDYVLGVDLARIRDFTVLTVIDKYRRHVVYQERFNQISWEVQYHKIIQITRQYNASVVIDSTGIGDPIVQTLSSAGLRLSPYKIGTSAAKQQLIDRLRVAIENNEVSYPYNKYTAAMIEELRCYEMYVTENGIARYGAPSGKHDDCVISLALAYWGSDQPEFRYRARLVPGI